ncbi:hypothetical protein ACLOJK_036147 [Asimina triloba]
MDSSYYKNKLVLAPMIRVGTLPFRLLAAEYGADITYGEEIIDHRILKCERQRNGNALLRNYLLLHCHNVAVTLCQHLKLCFQLFLIGIIGQFFDKQPANNLVIFGFPFLTRDFSKILLYPPEFLGTTDLIEKGTGNVVFRTCDEEKERVVFQMGTSNAVRALTAAQLICQDVAAVDINMGCPKSFSLSGGMGAALLSNPELIHDILTTLRRNLDTPVTCKIRLLKSSRDTVELARRIETTGVSALAVHGRRVADRPRDPAKWNEIADVVAALSIPVIANGNVFEYEDFQRLKEATGASSVMVARGALWNASIFSPKGKLDWEDVKREYLRKLPEGKAVTKSENFADLAGQQAIPNGSIAEASDDLGYVG